jgi:small nuclear ribonucleoprotein (snRNP)-like protein
MAGRSASSGAAAKRPKGPATLAPLLRHLRGVVVTVELKNGRSLRGLLHETDSFMNLVLRKEADGKGGGGTGDGNDDDDDDRPFDKVHIRGPLIRYIHFPPRADLARLIKDGTDRERRARDKYKRNVIRKKGEQR